MKKIYEMPVANVTMLMDEDVITTSTISFSQNASDDIQNSYSFGEWF
ncbi:MAG: hypothetical protein IJZ80_09680 [Clostridia bacterium]|nr:hypothetical protein [Clostridia bacterium]